jgi:hypothetical protein
MQISALVMSFGITTAALIVFGFLAAIVFGLV